jgi:siroheme synthase-like protein
MIPNRLYMACLNLSGRGVLVVGGGRIAREKVDGLLQCEAAVHVVAPEASPEVKSLVDDGVISWDARPFEPGDLEGKFLVVAATSDTEVNRDVHRAAEQRAMLVNVVDVPELCNFVLPAVHRTGPLAVAVSTAGASPALAKRIRTEIADNMGTEYARLAELLDEARGWAKKALPTYDDRKNFFEAIVNGEPDPIELLRRGDEGAVTQLIEDAKQAHSSKVTG